MAYDLKNRHERIQRQQTTPAATLAMFRQLTDRIKILETDLRHMKGRTAEKVTRIHGHPGWGDQGQDAFWREVQAQALRIRRNHPEPDVVKNARRELLMREVTDHQRRSTSKRNGILA